MGFRDYYTATAGFLVFIEFRGRLACDSLGGPSIKSCSFRFSGNVCRSGTLSYYYENCVALTTGAGLAEPLSMREFAPVIATFETVAVVVLTDCRWLGR